MSAMSNDILSTVKMPAYASSSSPRPVAAAPPVDAPQAVAQAQAPVVQQQQVQRQAQTPPSAEMLKAAAEQIDSYLKSSGRELDFQVDADSGQMVVRVRDSATGDVIRQIPGEEALRMARALKEGLKDLALVSTKA